MSETIPTARGTKRAASALEEEVPGKFSHFPTKGGLGHWHLVGHNGKTADLVLFAEGNQGKRNCNSENSGNMLLNGELFMPGRESDNICMRKQPVHICVAGDDNFRDIFKRYNWKPQHDASEKDDRKLLEQLAAGKPIVTDGAEVGDGNHIFAWRWCRLAMQVISSKKSDDDLQEEQLLKVELMQLKNGGWDEALPVFSFTGYRDDDNGEKRTDKLHNGWVEEMEKKMMTQDKENRERRRERMMRLSMHLNDGSSDDSDVDHASDSSLAPPWMDDDDGADGNH